MKKISKYLLICVFTFFCALSFAGCGEQDPAVMTLNQFLSKIIQNDSNYKADVTFYWTDGFSTQEAVQNYEVRGNISKYFGSFDRNGEFHYSYNSYYIIENEILRQYSNYPYEDDNWSLDIDFNETRNIFLQEYGRIFDQVTKKDFKSTGANKYVLKNSFEYDANYLITRLDIKFENNKVIINGTRERKEGAGDILGFIMNISFGTSNFTVPAEAKIIGLGNFFNALDLGNYSVDVIYEITDTEYSYYWYEENTFETNGDISKKYVKLSREEYDDTVYTGGEKTYYYSIENNDVYCYWYDGFRWNRDFEYGYVEPLLYAQYDISGGLSATVESMHEDFDREGNIYTLFLETNINEYVIYTIEITADGVSYSIFYHFEYPNGNEYTKTVTLNIHIGGSNLSFNDLPEIG